MFPGPAILSAQQELNLIRLRFYWIFYLFSIYGKWYWFSIGAIKFLSKIHFSKY